MSRLSEMVKIILSSVIVFYITICQLCAKTPHTIIVDGNLGEWDEDELIYDDSQNDSVWGTLNEIHRLYATWDADGLYLGVSGVQKDGNNLIVYIDTSPLDGITDASVLKDPSDSNSLWWWRRGNIFGDGFRPDFQWQMYEMRLNAADGHGLFRLYPDGKTANLNNLVEQKSSGGGTGVLSYAEIKLPWNVLFGDAAFPDGEEIRIVGCVTGGMDTRGTSDTSDDLFGSARDVIPDQRGDFPPVWYDTYTITNYLTLKISEINNRSPIPRALKVYQTESDGVRVEWRSRRVSEKKLAEYRVYYSSSVNPQAGETEYKSVTSTYVYITGLTASATYHFCVRPVYETSGGGRWEGGASETVSSYLSRPDLSHKPTAIFCFPGRKMDVSLVSSRPILSAVIRYAFSTGEKTSYDSLAMDVSGSSAVASLALPSPSQTGSAVFYYFEITDACGGYLLPPLANPSSGENLYVTAIKENSPCFLYPSTVSVTADFGGGITLEIPSYGLLSPTTIYFKYYSSAATGETSLYDGGRLEALAYYDFYTPATDYSQNGVVFEKPVNVTLRYFDEDVGSADVNSLLVGRLSVGQNVTMIPSVTINPQNKTVSFETGHFSRFGLFKSLSSTGGDAVGDGILKKIIRPVFNPSRGEVVEFDFNDSANVVRIEIFDLRSRMIRSIEGKNFWDGRDGNGGMVLPGAYLWRITTVGGEKIYGSCVIIR